jgi:hypothetical protein
MLLSVRIRHHTLGRCDRCLIFGNLLVPFSVQWLFFLVSSVRLSIHAFCNVALCRLLGNSVALKDRSALEISVFYTIHTV